jgi:hypothetical protein
MRMLRAKLVHNTVQGRMFVNNVNSLRVFVVLNSVITVHRCCCKLMTLVSRKRHK